jgi:hypothetical protein
LEAAQCAAEAANADPQLANVLHAQSRIAFDQADGIVGDLRKTFVEDGTKGEADVM